MMKSNERGDKFNMVYFNMVYGDEDDEDYEIFGGVTVNGQKLDHEAYTTAIVEAREEGIVDDPRFVIAWLFRECQKAHQEIADLTDYRNPDNILRETNRPVVLELSADEDGWNVVKTLFKNGYHVELQNFTDNTDKPNILVYKK